MQQRKSSYVRSKSSNRVEILNSTKQKPTELQYQKKSKIYEVKLQSLVQNIGISSMSVTWCVCHAVFTSTENTKKYGCMLWALYQTDIKICQFQENQIEKELQKGNWKNSRTWFFEFPSWSCFSKKWSGPCYSVAILKQVTRMTRIPSSIRWSNLQKGSAEVRNRPGNS